MHPLVRFGKVTEGSRQHPTAALDPIAGWYGSCRVEPGISGRVARFDSGKLLGHLAGFRYASGLQIRIEEVIQRV